LSPAAPCPRREGHAGVSRRTLDPRRCPHWLGAILALSLLGAALAAGCGGAAATGEPSRPAPSAATASARTASAPTIAGGTQPGVSAAPPASAGPPRPTIVQTPIPFGTRRKAEMTEYAVRHYGLHTYRLIAPHVIVIHYTETPDFQSTFNTFAPDVPDSELHELPGTCAHFVIDRHGVIRQLVPLGIMCRHTVGLNWTAIGIEHVGYSDGEVLADRAQIGASLKLVRWLRCRFHIGLSDVIGHNESLSSPYHHERVAALRTQTHSDFNHADMQVYRSRLRAAGGC
jgi:beta-N-acetylhexosaminidase